MNKCLLCPNVALKKGLCTKCNTNYFPKEYNLNELGEYMNCYKELEGYYLDNYFFKKCHYSCKTCNISGNNLIHNCIECNINYPIEIKNKNYSNCYENISYFNIIKNLKINGKKFVEEEEINYHNNILKIVEKLFTDNYNTSKIDKGQDDIIETDKMIVTFTTSQNQKNNINNNMTKIDLGECETLLRNFYNLSINETLYIKKIDIYQEKMKALKVEYDIYCKLLGANLIKLNLSICGKSKIIISIPISITENLDKFNSSSGYYNDICYVTTSEDGTDILLKDRQKEFIDKDKIVYQEDCYFSEYNFALSVAKCSCNVKEASQSFDDMKINKMKLLENFKDIKNFVNLNFLVCYKKLFNKNGIINNIGFYIIFVIIIFNIFGIFIFTIKQFPLIKKSIKNIVTKSKNYQFRVKEISIYKFNHNKNCKNKHDNKNKLMKDNGVKLIKKINYKNKKNSKIKMKNNNKIVKKENIGKYIDEEINGFSYYMAIKYDKRTYCQYYISLLKTQHNLICAIFNNDDYNSGIIKINLFFVGFTIEYTVNELFYTDDTMHKIYKGKGKFDFETQIPIIVYSTLISSILNYPLNFLALSNNSIINFKQNSTQNNSMKNAKRLMKRLILKFSLYFIISFLFLLFFWYYISMFGVIYKNTQMHLLKDILMGFSLSLIIPFIIYLFPGIFRIPALSSRKSKRKCLYNFSQFLQSI